jgi:hypothetical protein
MIRLASLALIALTAAPALAADLPPPVWAGDAPAECRQTWEHLAECKDKKTGRVVARCKFDNLVGLLICQKV